MADLHASILKRIDILEAMEKRLLRGQATAEQIAAERRAMLKPNTVNRGGGEECNSWRGCGRIITAGR